MNNTVQKIQEKGFSAFIYTSYFLIILTALGLSKFAPNYLKTMDYYVKIYVCLFLIYRFNPFRQQVEFTNLDRKIAFSSGLFILTTTAIDKYVMDISKKTSDYIFQGSKDNLQTL
jgi:hypothetical protein